MKPSLFEKIRKNHSLAMVLCCAVPLALIIILSVSGRLGSWGYYALILLCPLMHVFMMRGHASSQDDQGERLPSPGAEKKQEIFCENSS